MAALGSTGAGTPPKASNGRFGPGKEDEMVVDVKLEEGGWIVKVPVSGVCLKLTGVMVREELPPMELVDKGATITAFGWLDCVEFGFGMVA